MKKLFLFVFLTVATFVCYAQEEFTIHSNGLIYDTQTMQRLSYIVDSMHVRFRTCEPHEYKALAQGPATFVRLKKNIDQALKAMAGNITPEELIETFPVAFSKKHNWIIKSIHRDYRGNKIIQCFSLPLRGDTRFSFDIPYQPSQDKTKGWIFQRDKDGLKGLYLDLNEQLLPFGYARLAQYADCMIDTTVNIYLNDKSSHNNEPPSPSAKAKLFLAIANDFEGAPKEPDVNWDNEKEAEDQYQKFFDQYNKWNLKRLHALDAKMKRDPSNYTLLKDAIQETIQNKTGDAELEFYAERYISAELSLQMKRYRKVIGRCSMDQGPRVHAANICRLAAETAQWDIFLRAHLDIMNDRFSRITDGSYAWEGRGTYLKELEALNINAIDLLLGIYLSTADAGDNHYYGDLSRTGRALSETASKNALENRMLLMIQDQKLDLFNRIRMAYLFENYNYYLRDEDRKQINRTNFLKAVESFPNNMGAGFSKEEKN